MNSNKDGLSIITNTKKRLREFKQMAFVAHRIKSYHPGMEHSLVIGDCNHHWKRKHYRRLPHLGLGFALALAGEGCTAILFEEAGDGEFFPAPLSPPLPLFLALLLLSETGQKSSSPPSESSASLAIGFALEAL